MICGLPCSNEPCKNECLLNIKHSVFLFQLERWPAFKLVNSLMLQSLKNGLNICIERRYYVLLYKMCCSTR